MNFPSSKEQEKLFAESERLHRALLDSVSHELKTPLCVLSAAAESLLTATEPIRTHLIEEIRTATRRLSRLVDNLLDQTRCESGVLQPKLDWCDVHELINAAVDATRDSLGEHPLKIVVSTDMPFFRSDFALMERVLANLLLNSALHTPPGTTIVLSAGVDGSRGRIFFTVADHGPGLPENVRKGLFQKFQRGNGARPGGLGLGLSIIYSFVIAQGGEIVAGENPGGGAIFTAYLPGAIQ